MPRALITAPVARDLTAEHPEGTIARIPGASNGTLVGYDTLDADFWLALNDAQLTIYTTVQSVPVSVRKYLVRFLTYSDASATLTPAWKRWVDCTALDFLKTNNGVKAVTALVAGDVPQEIELMHHWSGNVQETLGTVSA